jgi:hypothetical protein
VGLTLLSLLTTLWAVAMNILPTLKTG